MWQFITLANQCFKINKLICNQSHVFLDLFYFVIDNFFLSSSNLFDVYRTEQLYFDNKQLNECEYSRKVKRFFFVVF